MRKPYYCPRQYKNRVHYERDVLYRCNNCACGKRTFGLYANRAYVEYCYGGKIQEQNRHGIDKAASNVCFNYVIGHHLGCVRNALMLMLFFIESAYDTNARKTFSHYFILNIDIAVRLFPKVAQLARDKAYYEQNYRSYNDYCER